MKHYTDTIPVTLAEKLKAAGMPMNLWEGVGKYMEQLEDTVEMREGFYLGIFKNTILYQLPTYAEVFDWLMSKKNLAVIIYRMTQNFRIAIRSACSGILRADVWGLAANNKDTNWHEAANAAIEEALELMEEG